jgi:hypothetical protein
MLLPERAFGIKRTDSGDVMLGPAALPYLGPPLGCLSRIHTPTLDKGTDQPQSFRVLEAWSLIVLVPGFWCYVCLAGGAGRAVVPGLPGRAPAPTAPGCASSLPLGLMVLVRLVLAGRRAVASR